MATTKRGDTISWTFTASDGGSAVDLTTAQSVRLIVARVGTVVIDEPVTGDASGVVTYNPTAADVADSGRLRAELEVTWPDGSIQTFPTLGQSLIEIEDDLG